MVFGVKTAAKHNGMDMRMEVHLTPPSVENADIPDVRAEIFAIGSQFPQCVRRSVIKSIIQKLLVAVDERVQFLRDSEDHMEVWSIQYIFPAGIHPLFLWKLLAHGTASVTTGIVMNRNAAAVFTDTDVDTEGARLAVHDVISCFSLSRREFMCFHVIREKTVKDILD